MVMGYGRGLCVRGIIGGIGGVSEVEREERRKAVGGKAIRLRIDISRMRRGMF